MPSQLILIGRTPTIPFVPSQTHQGVRPSTYRQNPQHSDGGRSLEVHQMYREMYRRMQCEVHLEVNSIAERGERGRCLALMTSWRNCADWVAK